MSIIGIGTDIIEIKRIKEIVTRSGDRLAHRILSPNEWRQYKNHNQKVRFLAKRFVVKEAASKALGTGIRYGLSFAQFEVYNNLLGKPLLQFLDQAASLTKQLGVSNIHVTLTDERYYAYAIVIFEQ